MKINRKVMIVDDSAVIRKFITNILSDNQHNLDVIATAPNGEVCLQKMAIPRLRPDVVIIDIVMSGMNGIELANHIMDRFPVPIILISVIAPEEAEVALSNAGMSVIESGIVEFVRKPSFQDQNDLKRFERELISKVTSLSPVRLERVFSGFDLTSFMREDKPVTELPVKAPKAVVPRYSDKIIIIGASTGGTRATSLIISKLPPRSPPIVIVQHIPEMMAKQWVKRLQNLYKHLRISLAKDGEKILPNRIYVAPGGKHLVVNEFKKFQLYEGEKVNFVIPSVDVTFISAAKVYRHNVLGIVLTGMGKDGLNGARDIKNVGGTIYTEHESTCVVYSMPRAVNDANLSDKILPLHEIPVTIRTSKWF